MRPKKPKLSGEIRKKEVVLCRTVNNVAGRHVCEALVTDSISFSQNYERIPFFLRGMYHGKAELCTITINRNEYQAARRTLSKLPPRYLDRIYMNCI
ncbi:MAG: hypothetical protein IIZ61_06890 [Lachnospiraceae bacterium]|nr:hypothetical protein [Lachnospiraceae bacterium]